MALFFALAALLSTPVLAETIHGVVVFTRHGDRTTRMFPGYSLTNLGATQAYNSGQYYRERYIAEDAEFRIANISSEAVTASQIWASAPNQGLLFQTATNFLQGLYPPLVTIDAQLANETLANGTQTVDPLSGYQFILVQGQPATSEDTIWIKGDDNCPVHIASQKSYLSSPAFKAVQNSTADFYSQYENLLEPILGGGEVNYKNAYEIFDLMNVAKIHNQSISASIDVGNLTRLRYLADQSEWNTNFNASEQQRSIGGQTFLGGILRRMNETVARSARSNKFQLFSGSYDTFVSIFGLTNLTAASSDFYGLPDYASTIAFELFSEGGTAGSPASFPSTSAGNDTLRVRFLFRNGTSNASQLTAYPLFGRQETSMSYAEFVTEINAISITSLPQWCAACGSLQSFCIAANQTASTSSSIPSPSAPSADSGLSNAAAGGIGAAVTVVVVSLIAALVWISARRRQRPAETHGKESRSGSESDNAVT